jgi:hypothetical protein
MQVDVYYNLIKKCLSVRHKGKIIKHTQSVTLKDVTFIVSEKGRQRVIKNKRKNVHAVIRGTLLEGTGLVMQVESVTYNPYLYSTFVFKNTKSPIRTSDYAFILGKQILVPA